MVSFPPLINMLKFSGLSPRGRGPEGRHRFRASADVRAQAQSLFLSYSLYVRTARGWVAEQPTPCCLWLWPHLASSPPKVPFELFGPRQHRRRLEKSFSDAPGPPANGRQARGRQQPPPQRQDAATPFTLCQDGDAYCVLRERQVSPGDEATSPTRHGKADTGHQRQPGRPSHGRGEPASPSLGQAASHGQQPDRTAAAATGSSGMDASVLYRHSSGSGDNTGQCRRRNVRSTGRCIS